jgi:F420-dependent oxidoreductase-like protein
MSAAEDRQPAGDVLMLIGLQIPDFTRPEGAATLAPALAQVVRTADDSGFDLIGVMDHFFQIASVGPPENDMLEAYATLGFIAGHTSRAKLLTLVTGVHYRSAGLLAKTVTTLDVLSGGRAWLGIGAGWNEEESLGLGLGFPPLADRFQMLEEALQICLQMWRGDQTPYDGKHYQLHRPINVPQALTQPHPPIMIGGGGEKKTLRLVAKYGDSCNLFVTPNTPHKLDVLKRHCDDLGRNYHEIVKTAYYPWDTSAGARKILDDLKRLADMGFQGVIGGCRNVWSVTPLETIGRDVIPEASTY